MSRWIVNDDEEGASVLVVVDWALRDSLILRQCVTRKQFVLELDLGLLVEDLFDLLFVVHFARIKCRGKSESVVLGYVLELGASNGVMMLQNSKDIFIIIMLFDNVGNLVICCLLVD